MGVIGAMQDLTKKQDTFRHNTKHKLQPEWGVKMRGMMATSPSMVQSMVQHGVPSMVQSTVQHGVPSTVQSTVQHGVPSTVKSSAKLQILYLQTLSGLLQRKR